MFEPLRVPSGAVAASPVFFPVHHRDPMVSSASLARAPGMISNAFFFYKDRDTRTKVADGLRLRDLVDHAGILMTDSGAFQGFQRPLHLKNKTIVQFQVDLGADIVSPLDLVTGPWENRTIAEKKLDSTLRRVSEAVDVVGDGLLAGVQQGGRFLDLRGRATRELVDFGVRYIALGSLVPFLTRNHEVGLVLDIIKDTRAITGDQMPLHLYGAGDPVELPLFFLAGANVFDSSSFAHFAIGGWYMTPYGAVHQDTHATPEWTCHCDVCAPIPLEGRLHLSPHRMSEHNLGVVLNSIDAIRAADEAADLPAFVDDVVGRHMRLFPASRLAASAARL